MRVTKEHAINIGNEVIDRITSFNHKDRIHYDPLKEGSEVLLKKYKKYIHKVNAYNKKTAKKFSLRIYTVYSLPDSASVKNYIKEFNSFGYIDIDVESVKTYGRDPSPFSFWSC